MVHVGYEYLAAGGLSLSFLILYIGRQNIKINFRYLSVMLSVVLYSVAAFSYTNYVIGDYILNEHVQRLILNSKLLLEAVFAISLIFYLFDKFSSDKENVYKLQDFFVVLVSVDILLLFLQSTIKINNNVLAFTPVIIYNYLLIIFGYLLSFIKILNCKDDTKRKLKIPYLIVISVIFIAYILTIFFNSSLYIVSLMAAIIAFLVLDEDSSRYINNEYNIFNQKAFLLNFNSKPFKNDLVILLTKMNNVSYVEDEVSSNAFKEIKKAIFEIQQIYGFRNVYYLDQEYLVITRSTRDEDSIINYANKEFNELRKKYELDSNIYPSFARLFFNKGDVVTAEEMENRLELFKNTSMNLKSFQVINFDDNIYTSFKRELDIVKAIKNGIHKKSFKVFYQPIYDLEHEKATGAEALVRLIDPFLGFISPEEFIRIAEKNGLVSKIDLFVIEETCSFISEYSEKLNISYIDVNLSRGEAASKVFLNKVIELTERYNISPEKLHLEITETSDKGQDEAIIDNMAILSGLGYVFSLDDYGSGYASLDYLTKYNFDIIKVDKTLLKPRKEDPTLYSILFNVVNLSKKLNKKIIMEGVETKESVEELRSLGVEFIQGYYFSRPLPKDEYIAFLKKEAD